MLSNINRTLGHPQIKPIYPRYRLDSQHFRIGAQRELTAGITDPDGQAWSLMDLLDGSRPVQQVVTEMRTRYPDLTMSDVENGIAALDAEGFLGDSSPSVFDVDPELARYQGNVNYFSHFSHSSDVRGEIQAKLLETKVALLGLGGGGSTVLQLLGAIGIGHLRAVDRDIVEVTNLNRQLVYGPDDIGLPKAEAAAAAFRRQNPLIPSDFAVAELTNVREVEEAIGEADIVVCAVDEPRLTIQRVVNRACLNRGVPCVYGVYQVTRGRVFSVVPDQGGCFDCLHLYYNDRDSNFVDQFHAIRQSGFEPPPLAYAPNVVSLCAQMVDELVRIVTGYLPPRSVATQLELDFETATTSKLLSWPRYPERCPSCGEGSEVELATLLGTDPVDNTRKL